MVDVSPWRLWCQNTLIQEVADDIIDSDGAVMGSVFRYAKKGAGEEVPVRLGRAVFVVVVKYVECVQWKLG